MEKRYPNLQGQPIVDIKSSISWQNIPNAKGSVSGGYEFYINEEWTKIRNAPLDDDIGFLAALRKIRIDADDERVRIRRVLEDDAILDNLQEVASALVEIANTPLTPSSSQSMRQRARDVLAKTGATQRNGGTLGVGV